MPNITTVTLTNGLGTAGTGTISTLDNFTGATQSLNIAGSGTAITQTGGALDINLKSGGNANGQTTMAASAPVTVASDQSAIKVNIAQVNGATVPVGSGVQATAERVTLATDSPGIVTLGGATPANSVPVVQAGFTYGNMTTATTTTFKSGAGVLHSITINSLGTVASTISVFDNTAGSGTSIAVLNSLTTGQATYTYDVAFTTGLTLVTTGTVAPNVTVSYR